MTLNELFEKFEEKIELSTEEMFYNAKLFAPVLDPYLKV